MEIQAEEDDILREIKKGNRRERKEEEDRLNEKDTEKTGLRENDRTMVEEILGEGDEIETQEKERKQRRRNWGEELEERKWNKKRRFQRKIKRRRGSKRNK